ncbi:outer membrane beta-barrel protein, partial [uncultured Muribaculum sp.]
AVHKSSYIPVEMSTEIIPEYGNDCDSVKPESSGEVAGNDKGESTTNESKPEGRPVPKVNDEKSDRIYNNRRMSATKRCDANSGRLSLGVFTSGSPNLSNNRLEYAGKVTGVLGADKASWEDNPMLGILLFNQGQDVANEVKHRLPVRTGLSFAYRINDRLSIESGLLYTLLTSDLKYGSESHYIAGQQKLHYIGVPVNARYRVLSWRSFDLYASAGVLAEKCVSGKIERDFILDNHATQSEKEDVKVKPLQWSVNASAGLQFNITRALGIYAEPGVSCYIDNGSPVETIYSERPLNFNLNVGLRFTLGD